VIRIEALHITVSECIPALAFLPLLALRIMRPSVARTNHSRCS